MCPELATVIGHRCATQQPHALRAGSDAVLHPAQVTVDYFGSLGRRVLNVVSLINNQNIRCKVLQQGFLFDSAFVAADHHICLGVIFFAVEHLDAALEKLPLFELSSPVIGCDCRADDQDMTRAQFVSCANRDRCLAETLLKRKEPPGLLAQPIDSLFLVAEEVQTSPPHEAMRTASALPSSFTLANCIEC